jgi:hypothetical protein
MDADIRVLTTNASPNYHLTLFNSSVTERVHEQIHIKNKIKSLLKGYIQHFVLPRTSLPGVLLLLRPKDVMVCNLDIFLKKYR